jgi:hypothetical protein
MSSAKGGSNPLGISHKGSRISRENKPISIVLCGCYLWQIKELSENENEKSVNYDTN